MKEKSAALRAADVETSCAAEEVGGMRRLVSTRGIRHLSGRNFAGATTGWILFFRVLDSESDRQSSQTFRAFVAAYLLPQAGCHVLLRVARTAVKDSVIGTRIIEIVGHGTFLS